MKTTKKIIKATAILLVGLIMLSSCASTTMILSNPSPAKLYLNGEYMGETPYRHEDIKIIFSTTDVMLKKEGYEDFFASFSRNEEPDVAPIIFGFSAWPLWLWAFKYKPMRTYELESIKTP